MNEQKTNDACPHCQVKVDGDLFAAHLARCQADLELDDLAVGPFELHDATPQLVLDNLAAGIYAAWLQWIWFRRPGRKGRPAHFGELEDAERRPFQMAARGMASREKEYRDEIRWAKAREVKLRERADAMSRENERLRDSLEQSDRELRATRLEIVRLNGEMDNLRATKRRLREALDRARKERP